MDCPTSNNGVSIRLTEERWFHIVENHDDLAGLYDDVLATVEDPDLILSGYRGALIAVKEIGRRKYLAVIYKELNRSDGFIITAYSTSRIDKGSILWQKAQR
jgi:hypothetical protein